MVPFSIVLPQRGAEDAEKNRSSHKHTCTIPLPVLFFTFVQFVLADFDKPHRGTLLHLIEGACDTRRQTLLRMRQRLLLFLSVRAEKQSWLRVHVLLGLP